MANVYIQINPYTYKQINVEGEFNTPKKLVVIPRKDSRQSRQEMCPTCGELIGYHKPMWLLKANNIKTFRCEKCGQLISWE